jgi:murein endopeptidase
MDKRETNLKRLGFVLGSNNKSVNLSINALRRIDVDRLTVSPNIKKKTTSKKYRSRKFLESF